MSDGVKSEISSDIDQNFSLNAVDPKNVQELTIYVSSKTQKKQLLRDNICTHKLILCLESILIFKLFPISLH